MRPDSGRFENYRQHLHGSPQQIETLTRICIDDYSLPWASVG
jgi:hypothetical protein